MNPIHKELDDIWFDAMANSPCECKDDTYWQQEMTGTIFCSNCKTTVSTDIIPILSRYKKRKEEVCNSK